MGVRRWIVAAAISFATVVPLFGLVGCSLRVSTDERGGGKAERLTPKRKAAVEADVRRFVADVARNITQQGPAAWQKHLADSPAFFMASEGRLVFPNRQAATQGIEELTRTVKQIELRWGEDLRVDPLTQDLAEIASSWHEVRVDKEGHRAEESGFFTGLAERHNEQRQFRNAHWSVPVPPANVP